MYFTDFFVWYSRRESRLWRRAPMNSGCTLFSFPVYGRYQLAFLANRSLLLASPPSIPAVLFCAYANKKSPCILRTFLFGTPGGNRTHNGPLGGGCYIHLTTEAYSDSKRGAFCLLRPCGGRVRARLSFTILYFREKSNDFFPSGLNF